jgi:hypothetical protein
VNLGKLNEDNDIATMNISPSNEEPSIVSRPRRGEDAETISTRKRRDQLTTKRRFKLLQVQNVLYKRLQSFNGLPTGTR